MKIALLFLIITSMSSCAKLSYMVEQGMGQISLEFQGEDNADVLADPKIENEFKRKIKLIEKAKDYFFTILGLPKSQIYGETTFLDQDAVTYLVIHSPKNKIKAVETYIPFAGTFPYLGFFSLASAKEYRDDLVKENYHTYLRPVYAYSTLNHPMIPFHDNILSSFFHYKDDDLVNLVFHELVHTVLFIDNETQFNENLAQFVADGLMKEYLTQNNNYLDDKKKKSYVNTVLTKEIVNLGKELELKYENNKENPETVLASFLKDKFMPTLSQKCEDLLIERCWPILGTWNNARFAATFTYEKKRDVLEQIYAKRFKTIKEFLLYIIKIEDDFNGDTSFIKYLKQKR
jgi:predicted aminopeptidase